MLHLNLGSIEFSDLEFMENVGIGGYGTVSKGRWISKNKVVAIKMTWELSEREVSYKSNSSFCMFICAMWLQHLQSRSLFTEFQILRA